MISSRENRRDYIQLTHRVLWVILGVCIFTPSLAYAYIGITLSTGAILIITLLGLSILLALYVLVWFPLRRRLRRRPSADPSTERVQEESLLHEHDHDHDG